ncbi:MAG: oligosaccharide flippase family protein, partial [Bacteroidota bacterium]|nr:oligosaccharide flippase family protein [Bacteroidota bacterium]
MSGLKKLAGQTMWYGVSSIAARFINYLLTPYLTDASVLKVANYGKMSLVYAAIPLLNVLFTYGFETAYFRFSQRKEYQNSIYSTASISLFLSTILLSSLLWIFRRTLAAFAGIADDSQLIELTIFIVALDTLNTIPFAKLRLEGRPVKYALIRVSNIFVYIAATVFFLSFCPKMLAANPNSWISFFYRTDVNPVSYIVVANLFASASTLVLLMGQIGAIKLHFNIKLWKEMMVYSLPLIIVGLGGMIYETFDRLMLN